MASRAVKSSPSVSRDFLGEVAHYLIIGGAVEVGVGVANLPRFKQDRYCESRESLVRILHVSHSLPKARPVEKAVTLLDDDVVDLFVLKSPLIIGPQGIEAEEATMVFAGRVAYSAKQPPREVQSVLHPLAPWIELDRKMALLILQVLPLKLRILVVWVGGLPVGEKRTLIVCQRLVRREEEALPPPI